MNLFIYQSFVYLQWMTMILANYPLLSVQRQLASRLPRCQPDVRRWSPDGNSFLNWQRLEPSVFSCFDSFDAVRRENMVDVCGVRQSRTTFVKEKVNLWLLLTILQQTGRNSALSCLYLIPPVPYAKWSCDHTWHELHFQTPAWLVMLTEWTENMRRLDTKQTHCHGWTF